MRIRRTCTNFPLFIEPASSVAVARSVFLAAFLASSWSLSIVHTMSDGRQSSQVRVHRLHIFISLPAIELPRHHRAKLPLAHVSRPHHLHKHLLGLVTDARRIRRDVRANQFSTRITDL